MPPTQDLFPPVDIVRVSKGETFRRAYTVMSGPSTPDLLAGQTLTAPLVGPLNNTLLTLNQSTGGGINRLANTVVVELTAAQMALLKPGRHRLTLRATQGTFVDELVVIELNVVTGGGTATPTTGSGSVGLYRHPGGTVTLTNTKSASVSYMLDLTNRAESAAAAAETDRLSVQELRDAVEAYRDTALELRDETQSLHDEAGLDAIAVEFGRLDVAGRQTVVEGLQTQVAQMLAQVDALATVVGNDASAVETSRLAIVQIKSLIDGIQTNINTQQSAINNQNTNVNQKATQVNNDAIAVETSRLAIVQIKGLIDGIQTNINAQQSAIDQKAADVQTSLAAINDPTLSPGDYAQIIVDQLNRIAYFVSKAGKLGTPYVPDISGAILTLQANLAPYVPPTDVVSPYALVFIDQANRTAFFVDKAGKLGTPTVPDLAGAILALQGAVPLTTGNESGYAYAVQDQLNRIAFGVGLDGSFRLNGYRLSPKMAPLLSGGILSDDDIVCYGDSLTESGYPAKLATLFGGTRAVENMGLWGGTAAQIAFFAGATGGLVSVAGNQIPASGSVALTPANPTLLQTSFPRSRTGTLMGVSGVFARDASNNYTFTRTTPGTAVPTDTQVMFVADTQGMDSRTAVIMVGHNDYYLLNNPTTQQLADAQTSVLSYVALIVTLLKPVHKRFIVVSLHPKADSTMAVGGATYNSMMTTNNLLRDRYPRQYFNSFEYFKRNPNPAVPQDAIDAQNGIVPGSYRSDEAHFSDAGKMLMAQGIFQKINSLTPY